MTLNLYDTERYDSDVMTQALCHLGRWRDENRLGT